MQLMTDETENYHEWAEFSIVYQLASEGKYKTGVFAITV